MAGTLRRALRRARRGAWYAVAIGLVLMALGAGITSQLLPLAERHPDRVADWLGQRAGRPVAFDHLETQWTRRGPLLRVDGLRIGEGDHAIAIGEAEILVAQYAGLLPGRSFTELRLRGLELTLERDDDGRWQVRGLPGQAQSGGDPFAALEGLGELQVIDGVLVVDVPALGLQARLDEVDLRLRVDGDRVRAAARAWMVPGVSPLDITAELDRGSGDAQAWLALRRADLSAWTALRAGGIAAAAGTGRVEAWADLRGYRVARVDVRSELEGLRLQGGGDGPGAREVALGEVAVQARWTALDDGWRFDAPRLRLGASPDAQVLDGLLVAGGARRALLADRIDAGALLDLAPLVPGVPERLATWLAEARAGGVLHAVEVVGDAGGALRARARVEGLGFAAVGDAPGLAGLSGHLQGDAAGLVFTPDPAAPVVFDWPSGFGPPAHEIRLRGDVTAWRDGDGWQVRTPALRVDGQGYGAAVRGGLVFQGDGTRPAIDLAADVDEAQVPVARRFWIRHLMSPAAVHWLDTALVGGRVLDGRAVVSGDLDDWPFEAAGGTAGAGLFHASARLEDAEVLFDPEWPAATALDGRIDFVAAGFSLDGRARLGQVLVASLRAGIADFGDQPLRVDAEFAADAAPVLALLQASPLREGREEILDALSATGPLRASFGLVLPLGNGDAGDGPRIRGRVALAGARLAETRWDLAFDDVRGEARYDQAGFSARGLRVRRDGQPGVLSLRAGEGHVQSPAMGFEAELQASLDSSELAARAPQLAWLGARLDGRSDWTLALGLPADAGGDGAGGQLQLRSNLVGTRLSLPEPLGKPAAEALPARIDLKLPLGEDDVDVVLGGRVALRARSRGGRTGVLAVLGRDRVDAAPPDAGIRITGRTPVLDAVAWAGLFGGGDAAGDGQGLALQGIDLLADRLQLLGGTFPATRVVARPERGLTRIRFDGPALAGTASIPEADGATVSARVERLHWRSAAGTGPSAERPGTSGGHGPASDARAASGTAANASPADADIDPGAIPPLDIVVDDLRVADSPLGRVELRTRPAAGGLQVDTFRLRAPRQSIDVEGAWTGRGADARTRMQVAVDSGDFGALLGGLGLGGRLKGGDGTARFDASWPGSPAGFRLGELEGSLALVVKDGQLVEVEPGAGRFLGLLSVAELPRRLMLDFRDFFSRGFAFNRIEGTVRFADGLARSESLVIDGAAAEIHIGGSANLRAQTYDQVIEVQPRTGGLLTAVGALTAGPVGAAVGAVANAVFEKPLGRMGARTYHVTGPWKDPKVVVEGKDAAPADATPPDTSAKPVP
ncbi:YhdP family protein [Luteimonas sp. MC1750]|uniref:YhdP family protein n=1 Tax=Luteimonas sp. MC1750 TaxID=2799326 RepID=UPI0018F0F797|nr:YhdP family protein [Luteimonas sp. MC1750]MBJ6984815.1 TIGR02099 family protein [Luteimonas sp. MC1750]QQO07090.1 TIGR02099 family protein [Luteimonas sp. MC1750]